MDYDDSIVYFYGTYDIDFLKLIVVNVLFLILADFIKFLKVQQGEFVTLV